MKIVFVVLLALAVASALWWLINPSPHPAFWITRIWLGATLLMFSIDRLTETFDEQN